MSKYYILGYFGYNNNQLDGQTVKTRDMYRLLCEQYPGEVDYYDTQDLKYSKLSAFKMFWKAIKCKTMIYLPAHGNLKYLFPVFFILSVFIRFKIHYFVVGGWLREFISNLPVHRFMLKQIAGIHVETKRLEGELVEHYHMQNVDLFPNFRFFDFSPERNGTDKLRVVFMARVEIMKGLDWIFNLANYIDMNRLSAKISITFYGQIYEPDRDYFEQNVKRYSFVEYKGALQPSEIHETLCNYDLMLLPTHYYTEGLPGSIVDAYISGIPVIVTEWKHSREFVDDGVSGYIIPFDDGQDALIEKVLLLERDRGLLQKMQENALKKRDDFAPPSREFMSKFGK